MGFNENEFLKLSPQAAFEQSREFAEGNLPRSPGEDQIALAMDVAASLAWLYLPCASDRRSR